MARSVTPREGTALLCEEKALLVDLDFGFRSTFFFGFSLLYYQSESGFFLSFVILVSTPSLLPYIAPVLTISVQALSASEFLLAYFLSSCLVLTMVFCR